MREKFLSHDGDDRDDGSSLVVRIQSHPARLRGRGSIHLVESWRETTRGCCAARGRDRVWWLPTTTFLLGFLVHAGRNEAIRKARPVVEPRARRGSARGSLDTRVSRGHANNIEINRFRGFGFDRAKGPGIDLEERRWISISLSFQIN